MNVLKKWDGVIIYIAVVIGILCLRFVGSYPEQIYSFARGLMDCFICITEYLNLSEIVILLQNTPTKVVLTVLGGIQILIGLFVLCIFPRQMEQGVMILFKEWHQVLKSGLICYFMLCAIIGVFLYSLIGISIGAMGLIITHGFVFVGKIPLAIFLGYLLMDRITINKGSTVLYFLVGSFIMLFFECVYAIGGAFIFFVFPVFALGTLFCMIVNRYALHISYDADFYIKKGQKPFDRKKITDIITKDIETDFRLD